MSEVLLKLDKYPNSKSARFHGGIAISSFVVYTLIIILGFVPITTRIGESGTSTTELQEATSKDAADAAVNMLQSVLDDVYQLYFFDYVFIVAGLLLLFSIHSLLYLKLKTHPTFRYLPLLGLVFTVISRSLDSLENLWVLLMVSNPEDYASVLIPLLNLTGSLKWVAVGFDYGTAILSFIIVLVLRYTDKRTVE